MEEAQAGARVKELLEFVWMTVGGPPEQLEQPEQQAKHEHGQEQQEQPQAQQEPQDEVGGMLAWSPT